MNSILTSVKKLLGIAEECTDYDADVVTDCWQEAVADPQIQVIHNCTPNALHDEINLASIGAGKHLFAE